MQTHFAKAESIISLSVSLRGEVTALWNKWAVIWHSDRPMPPLPLGGMWFPFPVSVTHGSSQGWQVFLHFPKPGWAAQSFAWVLAWEAQISWPLPFWSFFQQASWGASLPPERPLPVRCAHRPLTQCPLLQSLPLVFVPLKAPTGGRWADEIYRYAPSAVLTRLKTSCIRNYLISWGSVGSGPGGPIRQHNSGGCLQNH